MTVIICSVASVSPGVVLHAGGHGTFPEIHVNSAVCSYDRRAAGGRCGSSKLSARWSCELRVQCNGSHEDVDAPDLSTQDTKIRFCFAANPQPSVTKAKWLMLFTEITTVYCRNHRKGMNKVCR
jgi:hypothetical protein